MARSKVRLSISSFTASRAPEQLLRAIECLAQAPPRKLLLDAGPLC